LSGPYLEKPREGPPEEPTAWPDRKAYDAWWSRNVIALNRTAVNDPREYARLLDKIGGLIEALNNRVAT